MKLGYELFVSWRYLRSKRKDVFISLISFISISGVAIGVMALIIVLAVMTGLTDKLRDKILGTNAHIIIFQRGGWIAQEAELRHQIAYHLHVRGVAPFILRQVMIQSDNASAEVSLKGIDREAEQTTSTLAENIPTGQLDFLETPETPGNGILIGSELARKLNVTIGAPVTLVSPMQDANSAWPVPKSEVFQVTGIFDYGMYEYDSTLVYISLAAARKYLNITDLVTGLGVKVENIMTSKGVAEDLQRQLGLDYRVLDWSEMNRNLFAIFSLYKKLLFLMLTIIVIVACLNIASTLIMMVMEKNHDIAILKSMGASARSIQKLFVLQGFFIGFMGTIIGGVLGIVACRIADAYHLIRLEGGVYYLNYLPFKILPLDFTLVVVSSILICFVSTLYPAKQAARLDPAVTLRCD